MSRDCKAYNLQLMENIFANSVGGNAPSKPAVWGPKAVTTLYRLPLAHRLAVHQMELV